MFVMLFLARKEYYFFSLLCLFLVNSSSSTTRKRNRPAATAMVLLSLSFFLSFIQTTLLYNKTDFTVIENYYPYTERRERERKESVVRSLLCVCVIEMWDDRDKKEIQKKYVKRGTKTLLSFLVF